MEKKKLIIIIVLIVILAGGGLFCWFFFSSKEDQVLLKNQLNFEINSNLRIEDLIKEDNKVEILNKEEAIETNSLGEKQVKIQYQENNKEKDLMVMIKIVDTTSPEITYKKELSIRVGNKIDLLKEVKVSDNSKEEIQVKVEGEYDMNKEGEYHLKYVAQDSSGNKTEEEFTLKVEKVLSRNTYYPKLDVPDGEKEFVGMTTKGFEIYKIDGSTYIDDILIANKTYPLKDGYVPGNTYKFAEGIDYMCTECIEKTAYKAWQDMKNDAASLGLNLWLQSGYRPQGLQVKLYNNYVNRDGKEAADTYSSRPGHSEHQTGLCFDLNTITNDFIYTNEGKWVNDNAYKYGYIIRFPKGKQSETGYQYEPWHIRYVGTDLATKLYNGGNWLSLEDYFGITSEYAE